MNAMRHSIARYCRIADLLAKETACRTSPAEFQTRWASGTAPLNNTSIVELKLDLVNGRWWRSLISLVPSLRDVQLLAAPKKKVSPHRKGNRSASKHLRFIPIVSQCSKCERVFPPHAMPSKCENDDCPAFNLRERPGIRKEEASDN